MIVSSRGALDGAEREKSRLLYGARKCERSIYRMIEQGSTGRCKLTVHVHEGRVNALYSEIRESHMEGRKIMTDRVVEAQRAKFRVDGYIYQRRVFEALDNRETGRYIILARLRRGRLNVCNL